MRHDVYKAYSIYTYIHSHVYIANAIRIYIILYIYYTLQRKINCNPYSLKTDKKKK